MKPRSIIIFSGALNFALVTAILFSEKKSTPVLVASPESMSVAIDHEQKITQSPASIGPQFTWDQLISEDLRVYRDNLRTVGCPEATVHEIMRAVINHIFGGKRQAVLAACQNRYWDLVLRNQFNQRQGIPETEWGKALTQLAAERQQALSEVLGPDALADSAAWLNLLAEKENHRAWLPSPKRAQLAALERQQQHRMNEWFAGLGSRASAGEDQSQIEKWQQEFAESEKTLLTSEELSELQLRESDTADWAANLPGFNPTEDEWRTLTTLRIQFENSQNTGAAGLTDEEMSLRQTQLQCDFDASVKEGLGQERFTQYQLANNAEYQTLHKVTERYTLPDGIAVQGLDIQRSAQQTANEVRANSNLSPEAQQTALLAIQQETQRTLSQLLGPKVFATYQEYSGDWLTSLVGEK